MSDIVLEDQELKGIWKESVVAYLKAGPLFQHLSEWAEGGISPYYNGPIGHCKLKWSTNGANMALSGRANDRMAK